MYNPQRNNQNQKKLCGLLRDLSETVLQNRKRYYFVYARRLSNNFVILFHLYSLFFIHLDSNGGAKIRKNVSLSATGSVIDKENTKLSSSPQQKLEVGSPISSSLSSYSRIKVSIK